MPTPLLNAASKLWYDNLSNSIGEASRDPAKMAYETLAPLPLQAALYSPDANAASLGQLLYRFTRKPEAMRTSRAIRNPRHNFGMHVGHDINPAEYLSREYLGKIVPNNIKTFRSNVNRPLAFDDDLGQWNPDDIFRYLRRKPELIREDTLNRLGTIAQKYIDKKEKLNEVYDNMSEDWKQNYGPILGLLKSKTTKEMQQVLKDAGYDHITYPNRVEKGNHGKNLSAIIFNEEDVTPVEYPITTNPRKDYPVWLPRTE